MKHHTFNYLTDVVLIGLFGCISLSDLNLIIQVIGSALVLIGAARRLYFDFKKQKNPPKNE